MLLFDTFFFKAQQVRFHQSGCPLLPVETVVPFPVNYEQFPGDRVREHSYFVLTFTEVLWKCFGILLGHLFTFSGGGSVQCTS